MNKVLYQNNVLLSVRVHSIESCSFLPKTHPKIPSVPNILHLEIHATVLVLGQHQAVFAHSPLMFFFKGYPHPSQCLMHSNQRTRFLKMFSNLLQRDTGMLLQQFPELLLFVGRKGRRSVSARLGRQTILLTAHANPVVNACGCVLCQIGHLLNCVLTRLNPFDGKGTDFSAGSLHTKKLA